jgi:hypothetical protein
MPQLRGENTPYARICSLFCFSVDYGFGQKLDVCIQLCFFFVCVCVCLCARALVKSIIFEFLVSSVVFFVDLQYC